MSVKNKLDYNKLEENSKIKNAIRKLLINDIKLIQQWK